MRSQAKQFAERANVDGNAILANKLKKTEPDASKAPDSNVNRSVVLQLFVGGIEQSLLRIGRNVVNRPGSGDIYRVPLKPDEVGIERNQLPRVDYLVGALLMSMVCAHAKTTKSFGTNGLESIDCEISIART